MSQGASMVIMCISVQYLEAMSRVSYGLVSLASEVRKVGISILSDEISQATLDKA